MYGKTFRTAADAVYDNYGCHEVEGEEKEDEEEEEEEPKEVLIDGMTAELREKMQSDAETHEFRAETQRVMDIIVNSLSAGPNEMRSHFAW